MSLGLGSQIPSLQDQNHQSSTNMLRLGSGTGAPKFEHLISPSNPNSSLQNMPTSAFFMPDHAAAANQGFHHQDHQSQYLNKPLHGLMQLPDLQGNTNSPGGTAASGNNLFNLGFFSNNSNASSISTGDENAGASSNLPNLGFLSSTNQFNSGNNGGAMFSPNMGSADQVGTGLNSLYSSSSMQQHENISHPHMSATALLQKAAQMGSTTSTTNNNNNAASSLLRGLGSSSSGGTKSDHRPSVLSAHFGSNFGGGSGDQTLRTQMENDSNLQGLMNSLANGNSSIFGTGHGQDHGNFGGFSGSGMTLEQQQSSNNANFCNVNEGNKLTLDFLGVGGMVRNIGGGFSQREQQHGMNISSLDPTDVKSSSAQQAATNQQYGNSKLV